MQKDFAVPIIIAKFVMANKEMHYNGKTNQRRDSIQSPLHMSGKYRHASTRPRIITEEGKKNSNKSIHWGRVTEDFKFIPNSRFIYTPIEERQKLVFPKEWDLGEIAKPSSERKVVRPESNTEDTTLTMGMQVSSHHL